MSRSLLAWHFVANTLRDGRPIPADGEILRHDGPLVICESGLHASVRIIDALLYAPGSTICRVQCGGHVKHSDDKLICTERTILWRIDGTNVLRAFARQCALDVMNLWDMPAIVWQYLKTGDETIRVAAGDVAEAARNAVEATQAAARAAAAWAAEAAAAWAATQAAAEATQAVARAVALTVAKGDRDAARATQNTKLTAMVNAIHDGVV